jgi:predicted CopG family antitoxin
MKTITLEVSDPIAEKLAQMSAKEKKAVAEMLDRLISKRKSLEEIMKEASEQARKKGLTPEKLEELLKDK